MINDFLCNPLDPLRFPLVERFYKTHYPKGSPNKSEIIWTLEKKKQIIGAVRFKQFEHDQLITGLIIDEKFRHKGLASFLLKQSQTQIEKKACYGFAYVHLEEFYNKAGFLQIDANRLPEHLKSRFELYKNNGKNLISIQWSNK